MATLLTVDIDGNRIRIKEHRPEGMSKNETLLHLHRAAVAVLAGHAISRSKTLEEARDRLPEMFAEAETALERHWARQHAKERIAKQELERVKTLLKAIFEEDDDVKGDNQ